MRIIRSRLARVAALAAPLLSALLLAGCSASPTLAADELEREQNLYRELTSLGLRTSEPARRLPPHRIHGWQEVDDLNVILLLGVDERVLVRLAASCGDLDRAVALRFRSDAAAAEPFGPRRRSLRPRVPICRIAEIWTLEELPGFVAGA